MKSITGNEAVDAAIDRVFAGEQLDEDDYLALYDEPVADLTAGADHVRTHLADEGVTVRGLGYVTRGICSQDCGFCAYSARHDTDVEQHGVVPPELLEEAAKRAEEKGAERFNVVSTRRGADSELRTDEWREVLTAIELIREETDLNVDACLGFLEADEAEKLAAEDVQHYVHMVETSPRYFEEITSTHSFEDRLETLRVAKDAGIDLCSGIIVGMGETPADRIAAALELREVGIDVFSLNVLSPAQGTPVAEKVGDSPDITREGILKTLALVRFIHPDVRIDTNTARAPITREEFLESGGNSLQLGDMIHYEDYPVNEA
ncbi:biotin synthase BioB [Halomicrobium salinisoli]|uniref:biotin synthase BioB n=1 Tax=Halomicrobium salinisoli TaxID=2878391 RepID=UPI001CEFC83B|nr:biotin synthase BioB [Halomicrobium salinisoli]